MVAEDPVEFADAGGEAEGVRRELLCVRLRHADAKALAEVRDELEVGHGRAVGEAAGVDVRQEVAGPDAPAGSAGRATVAESPRNCLFFRCGVLKSMRVGNTSRAPPSKPELRVGLSRVQSNSQADGS